jgi:hypothetical protein
MQAAGHCRQCGQPSGNCCCECRKDSKELLVTPDDTLKTGQGNTGAVPAFRTMRTRSPSGC